MQPKNLYMFMVSTWDNGAVCGLDIHLVLKRTVWCQIWTEIIWFAYCSLNQMSEQGSDGPDDMDLSVGALYF